jgi:hypothetical protein
VAPLWPGGRNDTVLAARTTKAEPPSPPPKDAIAGARAERRGPTYDLLLEGRLLAQDLALATVADLTKLAPVDICWAVEEHGRCDVVDDSGRDLALVPHDDGLPTGEVL